MTVIVQGVLLYTLGRYNKFINKWNRHPDNTRYNVVKRVIRYLPRHEINTNSLL